MPKHGRMKYVASECFANIAKKTFPNYVDKSH